MRFSSKFIRMSVILAVVLLFVVAGIGSGSQIASLAQGSTPAATTQTFAPCPSNGSSSGGASATMSSTDSAGGASGSSTGDMSATMSSTDTTGGSTGTGTGGATMSATSSVGGTTGSAYIGIQVTDVENCGVQILQVVPGSPAETAKLQVGDVIVAVDGQPMSGMMSGSSMSGSSSSSSSASSAATATMSATSSAGGAAGSTGPSSVTGMTEALVNLVQQHQSGDMLTLTIQRAGQQMDVQVTLGTNPASSGSTSGGSSSGMTPEATATASQ